MDISGLFSLVSYQNLEDCYCYSQLRHLVTRSIVNFRDVLLILETRKSVCSKLDTQKYWGKCEFK